jgi:biotin transport system ATP-binding protein
VAFSLRRQRLPRAQVRDRVRAVLERFGLDGHADHPAHLLSGGQKQLLALASVLVTDPQVLVCDEPTTLLDARNTRRVTELLGALDQQLVLVTHQLEQVSDFDRVLVMDAGRVVADGPAKKALAVYRELVG